jgi:hypothetical protein
VQLHARQLPAEPCQQELPARRRRRGIAPLDAIVFLVSAAVAALALVASYSDQGPALLPAANSQPHTAVPSPAPAAQVITAYTAYFPALVAAEPQPPARAAAMLTPHAAQPYLGHVLAQIAGFRARGEVAWGYLVPHITSVQITGNGSEAIVRDCQDAASAWLVSSATGKVIPGTTGSYRTALIAALARGADGRWRLALLAHLAGSCSRVPSPP